MKIQIKCRVLVLALLITCLVVRSAGAQAPAQMSWLHEGLCMTYTWHSAVAAGNGSDYTEDEHGDWVNPATGQRYTRSTQQGTSGSGWNQLTVACIEADKAVVSLQIFGDAGALGRNVPVPLQGGTSAVTPIDQAADYWMNPEKLRGLHTDAATGLLVTNVQWKMGDKSVNALRVQSISGGNYSLHVFDASTGLCLHYATSSRGAPPKLVGPGDSGQGDVTLTHGDLVGRRDLTIPWAHAAMPDWVKSLKALHYRGSMVSRSALPTVPNEITVDLTMEDHGKNWAQMSSVAAMQMQGAPQSPPSRTKAAFGPAQFGGLWSGAAELAALKQGQVLDEDPLTKMRTVVARTDDRSIVISQQNPAGEIDSQYEKATGMLTGSSFVNVLSQQQISVQLKAKE